MYVDSATLLVRSRLGFWMALTVTLLDAESMVVDPKVACPVAVLVTDPPSTSSWVTLCSAVKTHVSPTSSFPSLSASPES